MPGTTGPVAGSSIRERAPLHRRHDPRGVRALLDDGVLYVAHFAGLDNATGLTLKATGQSLDRVRARGGTLDPPQHGQPGPRPQRRRPRLLRARRSERPCATSPGTTSAVSDDNDVRLALHRQQQDRGDGAEPPRRPGGNPRDPSGTPRLYISFTGHGLQVALDQNGVVFDPDRHATASPSATAPARCSPWRKPTFNPSQSGTFRYFAAWRGPRRPGSSTPRIRTTCMIDGDGGVLACHRRQHQPQRHRRRSLLPGSRSSPPGGIGGRRPGDLREGVPIVAMPSDAEVTGPAFSSNQGTIFLSVQHLGAGRPSSWPPR